jgi:hypothetical protein
MIPKIGPGNERAVKELRLYQGTYHAGDAARRKQFRDDLCLPETSYVLR